MSFLRQESILLLVIDTLALLFPFYYKLQINYDNYSSVTELW
jgi:hypothetical protein